MNYNIRQRKISPEIRETETNNKYYSFTREKKENASSYDLKMDEIRIMQSVFPKKMDISSSILSLFSAEKKD